MPEKIESANDRVRRALDRLGAEITHEDDQGGVDFELGDITGFARERQGKFRLSYFIAIDPDQRDGGEFVAEHSGLPQGVVQFLDNESGSAIRLLVELPYEESREIWSTVQTARGLCAAWLNRHSGDAELVATLGAAGIALPPRSTGTRVQSYGAWSWGSRYLPPFEMYMFDVELVARQLLEHGGFFAMSHAGHGVNSYGLNLVTSQGPVAAFVQHLYGGAYSDPVHTLIDINATYARLHVLMRAVQRGPLAQPRWLLVYSNFRGKAALIDLKQMRHGTSLAEVIQHFDSEPEVFEAVVDQLRLTNPDFGTAGRVSW